MKDTDALTVPAGDIGHDINNCLVVIIGTVDTLLTDDVDSAVRDGLKEILAAAIRMEELMGQVSGA